MSVDSKLFKDLMYRGIFHQVTDPNLEKVLAQKPMTLYAGFDPTSDCLHIGSLLPLLTLKRFQMAGHKVIAVAGGATGMIGDPSGKSAERQLLTKEILDNNLKGISKIISKFLIMSGSNSATVVNNADWFEGVSYIDFLRDVGKHFTINHMMAKESVRARLEDREHGISYTEFSYMLLQAYDYYVLNKKYNCRLQIGGSDQWGNITAGCELIRRMKFVETQSTTPNVDHEVFGFTHPLVTKSDGAKFGKTEKGNIWLDTSRSSVYQFYQFFIQTADADVIQMLKYFTFLTESEISQCENSLKTEPEKRIAQITLARELTKLVHGEAELTKVENASKALFGTEIKNLDSKTLLDVFADAPSTKKSKNDLKSDLFLLDLIVESGLCKSKGNARQDIQAGAIYVNNERVQDVGIKVNSTMLIDSKFLVLRKGKKNYHLISFD